MTKTQFHLSVVFLNLGRGVSASKFAKIIDRLVDTLGGHEPMVWCFVEVDEADVPNEHRVIADKIGGAHEKVGWSTREPMLVPRAYKIVRAFVTRTMSGVKRWSPARDWVCAVIDVGDWDVLVMNGHYPAGAKKGDRPSWAKPLLLAGWHLHHVKGRRIVRRYVKKGVPVVVTTDVNDHHPPRLHADQRVLAWDKPDAVLAVCPPGWRAWQTSRLTTGIGIDSHSAIRVGVRFEKVA